MRLTSSAMHKLPFIVPIKRPTFRRFTSTVRTGLTPDATSADIACLQKLGSRDLCAVSYHTLKRDLVCNVNAKRQLNAVKLSYGIANGEEYIEQPNLQQEEQRFLPALKDWVSALSIR